MKHKLARIETGRQPMNAALRRHLGLILPKREPNEVVVIHHYTDTVNSLQLEVERRSEILGVLFERVIL